MREKESRWTVQRTNTVEKAVRTAVRRGRTQSVTKEMGPTTRQLKTNNNQHIWFNLVTILTFLWNPEVVHNGTIHDVDKRVDEGMSAKLRSLSEIGPKEISGCPSPESNRKFWRVLPSHDFVLHVVSEVVRYCFSLTFKITIFEATLSSIEVFFTNDGVLEKGENYNVTTTWRNGKVMAQ